VIFIDYAECQYYFAVDLRLLEVCDHRSLGAEVANISMRGNLLGLQCISVLAMHLFYKFNYHWCLVLVDFLVILMRLILSRLAVNSGLNQVAVLIRTPLRRCSSCGIDSYTILSFQTTCTSSVSSAASMPKAVYI